MYLSRTRPLRAALAAVLLGTTLATVALTAPGASAATGDKVKTIIADRTGTDCASTDAEGGHGGLGVGVAFDGTNLLFSCSDDNTITFVTTANGSQVRVLDVTNADQLGAMAYDGKNKILYACSADDLVGTVDVTTGAFTTLFTSDGCFDGLAYDGKDNTIWSSADVSSHVEHYALDGTQLSTTSIAGKLGNCGNSGLAVGGDDLFLGNNGCSEIYKADKSLTTIDLFIDSVKTGDRRVEDLECDNLTFAATGQAVIWSVDAYDNIMTAYEIPNGTCFFGGGVIPTTTTTTTASTTTTAKVTTTTAKPAAQPVAASPAFAG